MDMNYLVQRKINAKKAYRKKVMLTLVCSSIILILMIAGLIKVILDEKNAEDNTANKGTNVSENITPGLNGEGLDSSGENSGEDSNSSNAEGITETTPVPTEPPATPTPTPTPTPIPVAKKLVVVDPGHGGHDLGSPRPQLGIYEKEADLAIALFVKKELEDAGYEVLMIREEDVFVENPSRPATAIEAGADAYVSIHLNSLEQETDSTQGTEVWYADMRNDGSDVLAKYVLEEVCKETGAKNRGIKMSNNLIVLKYNGMPACLVECGFMSSPTELTKLFDPEYQQKIAKGIANGIKKFLPLE